MGARQVSVFFVPQALDCEYTDAHQTFRPHLIAYLLVDMLYQLYSHKVPLFIAVKLKSSLIHASITTWGPLARNRKAKYEIPVGTYPEFFGAWTNVEKCKYSNNLGR